MSKESFVAICEDALRSKGLHENPRFVKRFRWEIDEILGKEDHQYFLDLVDSKTRYPMNQNNLLVCWLLGIVPDFDIEREPVSVFTGDLPDIDIDYLPEIREYLKNRWSIERFGSEHVCNIGSYTTFGIKSALIDMARVHEAPRDEVMAITKNLEDKDEDGKPLTWDSAVRIHPELKQYAEKYPEVAEAAKNLLNRNRAMGVHAGGLIISSIPLHDLVPLVKRKEAPQASAWVEGLHGQELQPVGLVKFDLLVISNLLQIARCCDLVKKRHGLEGICARPGESDWTDVPAWRDNPKSLAMANEGDLKCIFQFDSEGMRALVKSGGVDRFEDMVAYSALFRPGCLASGMTKLYVERKRGRDSFELHPIMQPILEKTYGIMVYQEQIMQILHVVGDIPLKDCEAVRKAISKKKIEQFIKYKEQFVINGQRKLSSSEKELEALWSQIESWAGYGFNASHAVAYTYISMWLLYLKSHYPAEFYTAILSCETLSDKIKDVKMEARIHGVEMHRLDVNKSSPNFSLVNDVIYYGFQNVKGIGEGPAQRLAANAPYKSFEDFLVRFGTDASVLKPIVALRCFRDCDPVTLWKFADHYKDRLKKIEDRRKRFESSLLGYEEELQSLLPNFPKKLSDFHGDNPFEHRIFKEKFDVDQEIVTVKTVPCDPGEGEAVVENEFVDVPDGDATIERIVEKHYKKIEVKKTFNRWKELKKLWVKRQKSIDRQNALANDEMPKLVQFNPEDHPIDGELLRELRDPVACEEKFYGFAWIHELERSPDYTGNKTFSDCKNVAEGAAYPVEMKVKKTVEAKSRKGHSYRQVIAEDATGAEAKINVWSDDWSRWQSEFKVGNLLRVRLQPPSGGFNTYTLESNQQGKFRGRLRYRDKDDDPRIFVMKPGVKEDEKFMTDEEVLAQFEKCTVENP